MSEWIDSSKGVEAVHTISQAQLITQKLLTELSSTIVVSGPIDFVTNGQSVMTINHGSALMQRVTGMGCAVTGIIASFRAVMTDAFMAATYGAYYFALCGELAGKSDIEPAQFTTAFIDQLYRANFKAMDKLIRLQNE